MIEKKQARTYEELERDLVAAQEEDAMEEDDEEDDEGDKPIYNPLNLVSIRGAHSLPRRVCPASRLTPHRPLHLCLCVCVCVRVCVCQPLGWDGKPIPYWLYKLHGLNLEFKCEICGNYSYWGPVRT